MGKNRSSESKQKRENASPVTTGQALLRSQKSRRNLLFGLTLLTVFLVFGGAEILGDKLMDRPVAFLLFWGICIVLVGLVLVLAIYDIGRVRKAHRQRVSILEKELEEIARDAERLAEEALKKDADDD